MKVQKQKNEPKGVAMTQYDLFENRDVRQVTTKRKTRKTGFVFALIAAMMTSAAASAVMASEAMAQTPPPIPGKDFEVPAKSTSSARMASSTGPTAAPSSAATKRPPTILDQTEQDLTQQSRGMYPVMERGGSQPVGSLQRAWDAPYPSSGQVSPGVVRFAWTPNFVMSIRMREFMVTTIQVPEWDNITDIIIGDPVVFQARQVKGNVVAIRPNHAGADSNITFLGASGNVYNFYVRSEGWNSDQITDLTVYVEANKTGGRGLESNVTTTGGKSSGYVPFELAYADNQLFVGDEGGTYDLDVPDYIRSIAFDPQNLQYDLRILARTPEDADIAPMRVFHDGVWTYFDYGEKGETVRRPVVYLVVDGVDTMVNTRTAGPKGNILIAEAIGDFTLRNGNRVVCVVTEQSLLRRRASQSQFNQSSAEGIDGFQGFPPQTLPYNEVQNLDYGTTAPVYAQPDLPPPPPAEPVNAAPMDAPIMDSMPKAEPLNLEAYETTPMMIQEEKAPSMAPASPSLGNDYSRDSNLYKSIFK